MAASIAACSTAGLWGRAVRSPQSASHSDTAGSHCNHTNSYIHLSQLLLGTEGELGLSAHDISFPLLVWNRHRLSHGNERKLWEATNLCALLKPPPAALSAAGLTTLFLLHPQTPNIKFTLGLEIFFSCSAIPQISTAFFFFSPSIFRFGNR